MMGECYGNLAKDTQNIDYWNKAKKHLQESILLCDKMNKPKDYKDR